MKTLNRHKLFTDEQGSVMLETVMIIPLLMLLTFATIQVSALLFTLNSLNHITFHAARAMAVGQLDDETNGIATNCTALTGISPSGQPSVEAYMCDKISVIPGEFSVSASDGSNSGNATEGALITTQLNVLSSSILFYDPTNVFDSISLLQAQAQQIQEPRYEAGDSGGQP